MAQECFLKVWRRAGRWQPNATVGTWLHQIAYNLRIDNIRARCPTVPIEPLDPPSSGRPADQRLQDGDVARRVAKALAGLPKRQRGAIALVHYWELPGRAALIEEAAGLIGAEL